MKHLFGISDLEALVFSQEETDLEGYREAATEESGDEYELTSEEIFQLEGFEEMEESDPGDFPALELQLELDDGTSREFQLFGVFVHEEKEYAVLHPKNGPEEELHVMQLLQGEEDEICLLPVEEDELEALSKTFNHLYGEEKPME